MKLSSQIFIGIITIWVMSFAVAYIGGRLDPGHSIDWLTGAGTLGLLVASLLIYHLALKKIKRLHHEITLLARRHEMMLSSASNEKNSNQDTNASSEDHLTRLAHYDSLTSLPNRIFFNEMLNKTFHHAERHKKMMALLFMDLDRFKNINDALGHAAGDEVLKIVAQRFSELLGSGDILAHLGGDEFIILLNDIQHPKEASPIAEKLLAACAAPIQLNDQEFSITTSIGICIYPNDGFSLEDIQRHIDIAMYKAKHAGGGIFQYFSKEMNTEVHQQMQLEMALRKAISNNEFILHYQPLLNLKNGKIHGVEALIRWENPELGLVSPAQFIPLAEENNLIMQIGEWTLKEACRANKAWQEEGYAPIKMAINLSAKQFQHPDIAQIVENVLLETGLNPDYLELEITEAAIMVDVKNAAQKLMELKKMGVHIAIDDFGTGYTSISHLKKFPVDILKIDQNFIKGIPSNHNESAITNAIIALAHSLKMTVVAEGVETAEQLQYLANNHCNIVQGYYLSRPLPEQKIILQLIKTADIVQQNSA